MQTRDYATVSDIVTAALNETLGASGTQPTALQNTALIAQVDVINRQFVNAPYKNEPCHGWEWMEAQGGYNFLTYGSTTLNGALTTASTSVILTDGSNWPTAGRSWVRTVNGSIDYFDHTGRTTNTLSGVTNLGIPHASGETVEQLYSLPTGYGKAIALEINGQQPYFYVQSRHLPIGQSFTTRGAYMVLPEGIGTNDATLYYYSAPTDLSTGDDTDLALETNIPVDYQRYAIEMLKAHIHRILGADERVPVCLQLAQATLDDAISYNYSTSVSLGLRVSY